MPSPPIPLIYRPSPRRNVPVYKGAPNVKEYIPPDAAIYVDDFPSLDELMKYVYEVTSLLVAEKQAIAAHEILGVLSVAIYSTRIL
jgi:hypothetical protein